jgi:TldD protein
MPSLDPTFAALPLRELAEAALAKARALGVDHADLRSERIREQSVRLRDAELDGVNESVDSGLAVRVVHRGTWGFAAGTVQTPEAAVRLVEQAVRVAEVSAPVNTEPVVLAPEPSHGEQVWVSAYEVDPFDVPEAEKIALLGDWSRRLLAADAVSHVDAFVHAVKENKFYADTNGTFTTQQRVRMHVALEAVAIDEATGAFESMRTLAPPVGRGWEFMTGTGWDWDTELAALPGLLAEKLSAPSVEAGEYDLVIDPSNLWLTIHESIGHATELDRALGYEANYAGTTFVTPDRLGELRYGSPAMHVTGDRTVPNGLATIAFDDEGVAAQEWDIIADGVLVGYQTDRQVAGRIGLDRSNGCAFADRWNKFPLERMPNVSLQPDPHQDTPIADLIGAVSDGIYIVGEKSMSIDQQRYNFHFTGQRFYRIRNGKIAGQVRDVGYQSRTPDFWGALDGVSGKSSWRLQAAFSCSKGEPDQEAPVSHGCPAGLFRQINVVNTGMGH